MNPTHVSARASAAVRTLQWGQHLLFTVLLALALVQTWFERRALPWWVLPVGLVLLAAYGAGIRVARRWGSRRAGSVWLAVMVALWAVLAVAAPPFRWLSFALFLLSLHLLPPAAALGTIGVVTLLVVGLQLADNPHDAAPQVLGPVVGAVGAVLVAVGYRAVLAESEERLRLVTELTHAQAEAEQLADELARSQRESGALAERTRLARDIHDTLAQGFSSILLLARAAATGSPTAQRDALGEIEQTAAENLDEARRVVHALAPAQLEGAPLTAALRRLARTVSAQTGTVVDVAVEGEPRSVPTAVEVAVLRLAQGALANVRQHAGATRCVVTLGYDDDAMRLDVVDDGVGFDADDVPASASGFGLRAMRSRVLELGGSIEVESAPGDGTAVAAQIPTKEAA